MPGQGAVLSGTGSGLSGTTRVAGVIGDPVDHSLSPTIHNAAFAVCDLDWVYVALPVAEGRGADAVDAMRTLGLAGLSVTMPHKADVLGAVDRVTDVCVALGAANCLAWSGGELVAHNTDGDGCVDSLVSAGIEIAGSHIAVLGAGGAARAVVWALAEAGASRISVVNRTSSRAEALVPLAPTVVTVAVPEVVGDADIIVNATSVGMGSAPDDPDALPLSVELLGPGQTVLDLVYTPVTTALLTAAATAGATAVDGIGMLTHQAARAFTLWTGVPAPIEIMLAAAREAIEPA